MIITSTTNDQVKNVRSLQAKSRARRKTGLFVVEGVNLIDEALLAETPLSEIYYTEEFAASVGDSYLLRLSEGGTPLIPVSEEVMQAMSDTQTPQGVLAVLPAPQIEPAEAVDFALVIDGISDPGNMGVVMRAAVGAGVPQIVMTAGTVDYTNPKVVRAAAGAHFRISIAQLSWERIASLFADHVVFLADVGSGVPYYTVDWTQPSILIVSDEAHGPSTDARKLAHVYTSIPMAGNFDSLNVATAAGIMIFERARQQAVKGA